MTRPSVLPLLPLYFLLRFAGRCWAGCVPFAGLASRRAFGGAPADGTTLPRAGSAAPDADSTEDFSLTPGILAPFSSSGRVLLLP